RAERAADQNVGRVPELFLGQTRVDRREAAAAILRRYIDGVEAERARLLEDVARLGRVKLTRLFQLSLERHQFGTHETPRGFDQPPLLLGQREIHSLHSPP